MADALQQVEEIKSLSNGVSVAVTRMNGADVVHGAVLGDVLYKGLMDEAKSHQANFDCGGFKNVMDLAKAKKIQVNFLVVTLKDSLPKFAGCTIQFPTVFTEWKGGSFCHYPAIYAEDFFVSPEISSEFRKQTTSQKNPKGLGLGTYFEAERIKIAAENIYGDLPSGKSAAALVVEHGEGNKAAIRVLSKFGAHIEDGGTAGVFQFYSPLPSIKQIPEASVCVEALGFSNKSEQNLFAVLWTSQDRKQQISATFTEALSTFNGSPVVRVQIKSNGRLSAEQEVERAIVSLFAAGQKEILKRGWLPKISTANDILPFMRIHAPREPKISASIARLGGMSRVLGTCKMLPAVLRFTDAYSNTPTIGSPQKPTSFEVVEHFHL